MARIPSPLHTKRIPKSVSQPTETAEAAATVAESAVAPAPRRAAKKAKPATASAAPQAAVKAAKVRKPKLVRDSFTMPKDEYQVIDTLKERALTLGKHVRKSELLRAGIRALDALNDRALLKALDAVPTLKTGRPKAE
ncbi:hypothetical protein [Scleromatobacter humisilvae]|uniref:Uncharacterized protein n=1 Tax=Scleromatobacter humisilvae TaxID=2897159 RepID=A0A9X1YKN6_9BURK|nr:hypothetical protein [Scleromatobacter humisilvae]MCK9687180.1 hypothetical protein [Scleromatobacter humisilvae]